MYTRILTFVAILLFLSTAPSWAATCVTDGGFCSNIVSPSDTTAIFDFTENGSGYLVVQFDTVLTTFTLNVTVNNTIDALDPTEFPSGTVCVQYSTNGGQCVQYDFSGVSGGGPNNLPVKNVDYKGLITLTLSYFTDQTIHIPAFGHAPGDNASATYTENILTSYSTETTCGASGCPDPTMGGKVPGLSSIAAFDEPSTGNNTFCSLTLTNTTVGNGQKPQIEVDLKEASNCAGAGLRDKTATVSVSTFDPTTDAVIFPALKNVEGNKFHWDNKNGLNEYDISLDGLTSGQQYTVTVISGLIQPQSVTFTAP